MIKKEVSNSRHDSCQISAAAGIKGSRPITGLSLALPSTQSAVGSFIFTLKKIYSRVILNIEKGKAREAAYPEYYSINLL